MGNVRTRCYRAGALHAQDFPVDDVDGHLAEPDTVVWVDMVHPTAADLAPLAAELGLHELAVEDALEPHQRPKIDRYPTHLFVACHAARFDRSSVALHKAEIDAFVGARWLVTVRSSEGYPADAIRRRADDNPDLVRTGAGALVYALLDDVVDGYLAVVEQIDAYYDEVADGVFAERPLAPDQQREWFDVRRALAGFHRLLLPLREALGGVVRRDHVLVAPELLPYWQDLHDHLLVVSEETDSLRELVGSLVDANLSLRDYRQNQVMKKVSSWAAIVAAPTLITGYYGMNVPFPGSGERLGVIVSSLVIAAVTVGLYALFRRRDWL